MKSLRKRVKVALRRAGIFRAYAVRRDRNQTEPELVQVKVRGKQLYGPATEADRTRMLFEAGRAIREKVPGVDMQVVHTQDWVPYIEVWEEAT